MKLLQSFIRFIYSRGLSDSPAEESQLVGFLNIISFLTAIGSFSIFIVTVSLTEDYVYMGVCLGVTITYLNIVLLHHFGLIQFAKLYFSLIVPFWYVTTMLLIGGNFSQSIAAVATIVITFLMYNEQIRKRNLLIAYNIIIFIIPSIYLAFYPPYFGVREHPLDEVVVFLLCIGWISIIFSVYENKTASFINSLQDKNNQLSEKTTELERFNYIASHDLKSPLRNIVSFLNLIKRDLSKTKYDNIEEYIDYTLTGAHQMNELIKGVLEISTAGEDTAAHYKTLNLNEILRKAIRNIQQEITESGAEITADELPEFYGSESDLIIVFQNLIHNGIKYNESEKPLIKISVSKQAQQNIISFRDNGIGIAEEFYEKIFEYFKRLHSAQEYPGTGLGLGLCKKIIKKYKGDISVISEVGVYSEFRVYLPKRVSE